VTKALIMVDIQNDFMPTGALPVSGGHEVIPIANKIQKKFNLVIATQDWHPASHKSFAKHHAGKKAGDVITLADLPQVLWPDHCVQNTKGAEFVATLDISQVKIFPKGTDVEIDSYSGFFDNGHRKDTGLGDYLRQHGVTEVYILGVATDYCVKYTALDAVKLGFKTYLIEDGCRGVNLKPNDVPNAIEEMKRAGVEIIQSGDLK